MRATVVSSVNSAPVLEPAKHVLDLVALFVERRIVRDRHLAVCPRWNAGCYFALRQCISKPVSVISLVTQERLCLGESMQHLRGTFVVTHLPLAQKQD